MYISRKADGDAVQEGGNKKEDKKYWNTDEFKDISLEDLESIAGGFDYYSLNQKEQLHFRQLVKNVECAYNYREAWFKEQAIADAIAELEAYKKEMEQKYGR